MENETNNVINISILDVGMGIGAGTMLAGGTMLLRTAIKTKDWKMMVMAGLSLVGAFYVAKHFVVAPHISAPMLLSGNTTNSNSGRQDASTPTPQGRATTTTVTPPSNDGKGHAFEDELENLASNKSVDDGVTKLLNKI